MDFVAMDFLKINIDAWFREVTTSLQVVVGGAIFRDNNAEVEFVAATEIQIVEITDAMDAETMAMSNAVQVAEQIAVGRVIFKTDCINLQRALVSSHYDLAPIDVLISDLKFRLRIGLIEVSGFR
jgi:hypothetical protein